MYQQGNISCISSASVLTSPRTIFCSCPVPPLTTQVKMSVVQEQATWVSVSHFALEAPYSQEQYFLRQPMNTASRATQGRVHSTSSVYSLKSKAKTSHHVFIVLTTDLPVHGDTPTKVHFCHKQCASQLTSHLIRYQGEQSQKAKAK